MNNQIEIRLSVCKDMIRNFIYMPKYGDFIDIELTLKNITEFANNLSNFISDTTNEEAFRNPVVIHISGLASSISITSFILLYSFKKEKMPEIHIRREMLDRFKALEARALDLINLIDNHFRSINPPVVPLLDLSKVQSQVDDIIEHDELKVSPNPNKTTRKKQNLDKSKISFKVKLTE